MEIAMNTENPAIALFSLDDKYKIYRSPIYLWNFLENGFKFIIITFRYRNREVSQAFYHYVNNDLGFEEWRPFNGIKTKWDRDLKQNIIFPDCDAFTSIGGLRDEEFENFGSYELLSISYDLDECKVSEYENIESMQEVNGIIDESLSYNYLIYKNSDYTYDGFWMNKRKEEQKGVPFTTNNGIETSKGTFYYKFVPGCNYPELLKAQDLLEYDKEMSLP